MQMTARRKLGLQGRSRLQENFLRAKYQTTTVREQQQKDKHAISGQDKDMFRSEEPPACFRLLLRRGWFRQTSYRLQLNPAMVPRACDGVSKRDLCIHSFTCHEG
jgi:Rps23 Pro-64 3,4-dihydroxylase Tpa1-like proline 4-hydroxylase